MACDGRLNCKLYNHCLSPGNRFQHFILFKAKSVYRLVFIAQNQLCIVLLQDTPDIKKEKK